MLLIAIVSGYFLEIKASRRFLILICFFIPIELSIFNWRNFSSKPSSVQTDWNYLKLNDFIAGRESEYFRIYCTTGCPVIYLQALGTASGYNPIQLTNYYNYIIKAGGYKYNLYTTMLPVYQSFPDRPQPSSYLLGIVGVKYVFSRYPLLDPGFSLIVSGNRSYIYLNKKVFPRAFGLSGSAIVPLSVTEDNPGQMTINLNPKISQVFVNEIYTPLWEAHDQNQQPLGVGSYDNIILSVKANNAHQISVNFGPSWLRIMIIISLITSLSCLSALTISTLRRRIN